MPSLEKLLAANQSLLGSDLQHLGKYFRKGLSLKKSYLSYEGKGEWRLLQLNPFQVFLRRYFRFYQSTRLVNIAREWTRYQIKFNGSCPQLAKKLEELWSKTYPKQEFPPLVKYFGNSSLQEAQVICVARHYTDDLDSEVAGKTLDHYREGDAIIIEGWDADKQVSVQHDPHMRCMKVKANAHGWEPVGYMDAHRKIFAASLEIDALLNKSCDQLLKLFNHVKFNDAKKLQFYEKSQQSEGTVPKRIVLNPSEREDLWNRLLMSAVTNLRNVLKSIEYPKLNELVKSFQQFLESAKTTDECIALQKQLYAIISEAKPLLEKWKYRSQRTPEVDQFFVERPLRQLSLCTEIERHCAEGKRVLVSGGIAHFFPNRGKVANPVLDTLRKYKFTIGMANSVENDEYYSFKKLEKRIV